VALASGGLAVLGAVTARGPSRSLFLSGLLFAVVVILLSGTRGALVGIAAMAVVAIVLAIYQGRLSGRALVIAAIGLAVVSIVAAAAGIRQTSAIQRIIDYVTNVRLDGLASEATPLRVQMCEGVSGPSRHPHGSDTGRLPMSRLRPLAPAYHSRASGISMAI
jgi:hypothetical protein